MTPRESLEAAGWHEVSDSSGTFWVRADDPRVYTEAEAIARDEEKETSDGDDGSSSAHLDGDDRTSPLDTVVPDKAAPVATSVSATDVSASWFRDQNYNRGMVELLKLNEGKPVLAHQIETWLMNEYASSSSAALLAANEVIRRQLKKVCDQAEAAESKVAELEEQCEVYATNCAMNLVELNRLVDSRDRLQEALRESKRDNEFLGEMLKCDPSETLEDGFGSAWSRTCPKCGLGLMQVVRPGSAQCAQCG